MRTIEFEKKQYQFPDDASDAEVSTAIESVQPATWWKTIKSIPGVTLGQIEQGVGGLVQKIGETDPVAQADVYAAERGGGQPESKLEEAGPKLPKYKNPIAKVGANIAELGTATQEAENPGQLSYWQRAVQSGVSSALSQAPAIAASVLMKNPAPMLIVGAAQQGGQQYAETRAAGGSIEEANARAALDATAEAVFEYFPAKFLIGNEAKTVLSKIWGFMLREVPSEVATTAVQSANSRLRDQELKGQPWSWKDYGQDLLDTVGSVMVSGPLIAGTSHGLQRLQQAGEPKLPETPVKTPIAEGVASIGMEGITPSSSPQFDQPSLSLKSDELIGLDALLANIDPDTLTDEDVAKAQAVVAKHEELRKSPIKPEAEAAWMPLAVAPESPAEVGEPDFFASDKKAANAKNYPNPNTGNRLNRKFMFSTDPNAVGLSPNQIMPKTGTYTLGEESSDRSRDFLEANQDTIERWRQKHMPDSTFIISNEGLFSGTALGWHIQLAPKMHMIVPAVLRNPKFGLDQFSKNDQAGAFFTLSHEFNHALINDKLYGNMPEIVANQIREVSKKGIVPEELLADLNVEEQALIREFNSVKQRILNNSMSAQEFVETWLNPAKLGRAKTIFKNLNVAPTDNAMAVVKAIARKARQNKLKTPELPSDVLKQAIDSFLSLDEYLSEQLPKHMYDTKEDQKTPLGKFFKGALDSLREFFADLKGYNGMPVVIKPGTAFAEWLESLSRTSKVIERNETLLLAKKKGSRPSKTPAALKPSPAIITAKKKVQKVQHNVETDTDEGKATVGKRLVVDLVRSKVIEAGGADQKELLAYIRQKDWDEFRDAMQRHGKKLVKFELNDIPEEARTVIEPMSVLRAGISEEMANDPKIRADAEGEWQRHQFRSKYYKAYFGDWENDPTGSSKIRRGAIVENKLYGFKIKLEPSVSPPGELAGIQFGEQGKTYGGEPLVVFHSTRGQQKEGIGFEKFSRGDVGFHFGTVRAAHIRANDSLNYTLYNDLDHILQQWEIEGGSRALINDLGVLENTWIIPATLNIRNPLYVGEESQSMWQSLIEMLDFLVRNDVITSDQMYETLERGKDVQEDISVYKRFEATRQLLLRLGYDGIVYQNKVEGDTSYVAFHPNQIKSLLGAKTFSRSDNFNMELDIDPSKPEQIGANKLLNSLKNFTSDLPRLRRALRKVSNAVYYTTQLQQLAQLKPHLVNLTNMNEKNYEMVRNTSRLQSHADTVVRDWKELLGKENFSKLNKFLLAEKESGQLWWGLEKLQILRNGVYTNWYQYAPNETTVQKAQEYGLDEELTTLALGIKNVLLSQLNEAEFVLRKMLMHRYGNNPNTYAASVIPVARHIHELRKVPFFPEGRFGNRMLIIEKKKAVGPGYDIVWREAFEDPSKWEEAWKKAESKKKPDERVRKESVSDQSYTLMALPTDFLDMAASELDLSPEQVDILINLLQPVKREKALNAYDQARLGIKGYSTDTMRSFANFTWHNANLLSKLSYRVEFNKEIREIGILRKEAERSSDPDSIAQLEELVHVENYMKKVRDYIMAPPYEAQNLRAFVAITYLWMNIKTALFNGFGLMLTWSHLTSKHGDVEGNKIFFNAMKESFQSLNFTNPKVFGFKMPYIKVPEFNTRKLGKYLNLEKQKALDQAVEEGVLTQSYAYHLAGMATAGNLERLPIYQAAGKIGQNVIDTGMYTFRLMELMTRRITFLSQFESIGMEKNLQTLGQPLSFEEKYRLAVTRTNKLQNEYSRGNRVPFMRGFKIDRGNPLGKLIEPIIPLATVFMTFSQGMAFHAYGGFELGERRMAKHLGETPRKIFGGYTMRIAIIILLLAGYEGLPGAENLIDLVEILWRKFGGPKPMRQELREMIQTLEVDPHLIQRGLGYNIGGFDVSRSIGLGRLVSGTDVLANPRNSMPEQLGLFALDLAGPTGGLIKFGLSTVDPNKTLSKSFEQFPGGAGNIYTAYKWSQEGVLAPSRAMITRDRETGKIRDLTAEEIVGKAFGLNPEIVSRSRAIRFEQYDRQIYWQTQRKMLVDDFFKAKDQKDREAQADTKKAIEEFNDRIPVEYRGLKLTGIDLARATQEKLKQQRADKAGVPIQKRYRGLYEDINESHNLP